MEVEELKEQAALRALESVKSGMKLGLGTGSTVYWLLKHLGQRIGQGALKDINGVPTSERTAELCREFGITLRSLEDYPRLDLVIDGADEVTPELDLIKGLGGALLREKMVASAADKFIIIADTTKDVAELGEKCPLPVEVVRFAWRSHLPWLNSLGAKPKLRTGADGEPLVTDNGNFIIDCRWDSGLPMPARELEQALQTRPGVVETGFFLGMASEAFLAAPDGVRSISRTQG